MAHFPRRDPRHRLRFQVKLERTTCFTHDVSASGFCAEVMRVIRAGSPVAGVIRVGGKDHPFEGRVAWAKDGDARMNVRGRMGIVFESPPPDLPRAFEEARPEAATPIPSSRGKA
jgi:hypothetical protein